MSHDDLVDLTYFPALDHPDLVTAAVTAALAAWPPGAEVRVAEIDPGLADTAAFTQAYGLSMLDSANCVVVAGRRAGEERTAACVVRADTRADVNNVVKRLLDVRKASFLTTDRAVEESGMEYGGITPVGIPAGLAAAGRFPGRGHRTRDHRQRRPPLEAVPARQTAR